MAEIKISELSIGDWVMNLYANKPSRVIGLRTMFQDTYEIIAVSDDTQYMLIEDNKELHNFEPIPLTPEILEKNGWSRKKYTIDIAEAQEIEYDGYRHILCQDSVQYDIILADSFGGYFDLEIESSCRDDAGEKILISSRLSLDYVEFVHQLQHALRLAGVGKEIEV